MIFSLKPIKFRGATHEYASAKPTKKQRESGFDKETLGESVVPVYVDKNQTISVWKTKNFWARLHFLFNGRITLQTMGAMAPTGIHIGEVLKIKTVIEK